MEKYAKETRYEVIPYIGALYVHIRPIWPNNLFKGFTMANKDLVIQKVKSNLQLLEEESTKIRMDIDNPSLIKEDEKLDKWTFMGEEKDLILVLIRLENLKRWLEASERAIKDYYDYFYEDLKNKNKKG